MGNQQQQYNPLPVVVGGDANDPIVIDRISKISDGILKIQASETVVQRFKKYSSDNTNFSLVIKEGLSYVCFSWPELGVGIPIKCPDLSIDTVLRFQVSTTGTTYVTMYVWALGSWMKIAEEYIASWHDDGILLTLVPRH